MDQWLMNVLKGSEFGAVSLAASFLFGLSSAATTASCGGLPAMLVIVGYTGSTKGGKKALLMAAGAFFLSSVLALVILGALSGQLSSTILGKGGSVGFYGKKALGLVALFLGLTALDVTPFRLPTFKVSTDKIPPGMLGAILVGLSVGVATAGCATACSPLQLPIVLGFAALRGQALEGAIILFIFALGFTLPLVLVMLGVGLGKASKWMEKLDKPLRIISGIFMVGMGTWFLLATS